MFGVPTRDDINYLRVLANSKGIEFQIQAVPGEHNGATKEAEDQEERQDRVDLSGDGTDPGRVRGADEELNLKKRAGKTTTEENLQVVKRFWQNCFLTTELKEDIFQKFIYDQNPFNKFFSSIDPENHHNAEDNMKFGKQMEKVKIAERLLELLHWEHAMDENQIERKLFEDNFAEKVVTVPLFKNQKPLNESFDLGKAYNIHAEMTPQQILMWAISLLESFSLQI
jgi:hypothetical protein